ncbi:MAG: response regulator [Elusimicrobiota bacterium]|nr:MAG: response regulator [Elusimicrobiota bacterium]
MTKSDHRPPEGERKMQQRLAALVLDSNDAVIICDLRDRVLAWNKGAQKMYGYGEREALAMSIRRLMPERQRLLARDLVQVSAAPIETQRRTKDGRTLDVLLTVTVLHDAAGRAVEVATTERDITALKESERELRRLHARVISAQETERKRLARDLHDGVGQILSSVKYRLEALPGRMSLSGGAEAKLLKLGGYLDHAIAEIRRVSQNLMPSELVDLGLEPALQALCREFMERSRIRLTVRTVSVNAAPALGLAFYRIAQEALNNIGKHAKTATASVSLSIEGRDLVLTVSDNGVGFIPGSRPAARRGIGLGNLRQRAESVGGVLEVQSVRGKGTRLIARAPCAARRRDGHDQEKPRAKPAKKIKVFLIDDHPALRDGIRAYLSVTGEFSVVGEASDDAEALRKLKTLAVDVVILDISLPGMDGGELARRLRKTNPSAKLIAFSLHSGPEYVVRMARCGVHGYVTKDAPTAKLGEAITRVHKGGLCFPPDMTDTLLSGSHVKPTLTAREREVLILLAEGLANKQVARKLGISVRTAEAHREHLSRKLQITPIAALTKYAIAHGLTPLSLPAQPPD